MYLVVLDIVSERNYEYMIGHCLPLHPCIWRMARPHEWNITALLFTHRFLKNYCIEFRSLSIGAYLPHLLLSFMPKIVPTWLHGSIVLGHRLHQMSINRWFNETSILPCRGSQCVMGSHERWEDSRRVTLCPEMWSTIEEAYFSPAFYLPPVDAFLPYGISLPETCMIMRDVMEYSCDNQWRCVCSHPVCTNTVHNVRLYTMGGRGGLIK